MSHYAEYLRERQNLLTLEREEGFAIYTYVDTPRGKAVYIQDIYVVPEYRQGHVASEMADTICDAARAKGCYVLLGSVDPSCEGAHVSLLVLLGYGMKLDHLNGPLVFFSKTLEH